MDLGSRIKELRNAKKISLRELAEKVGVDFTYLSKAENSRLDFTISREAITKIAAVLETSLDELLDLASQEGQLDIQAIKETIRENPAIGILIRHLQVRGKTLSPEKIKRIQAIIEE